MTRHSASASALKLAASYHKQLLKVLGQPVRVVLFGSQARGDAVKGSDIDLLVILPSLEKATLDTALDVAWEVGYKSGKVISVTPATETELTRLAGSPFFRTIQKEGIAV